MGVTDSSYPRKVTMQTPELSWDAFPSTDHYDIYRMDGYLPSSIGNLIGTSTTNGYNDTSATAEGTYWYTVIAKDGQNRIIAGSNYPYQVGVDRTAPQIFSSSLSTDPVTTNSTTSLQVTSLDVPDGRDYRVEYYVGSTDPGLLQATEVPYVSRDETTGQLAATVDVPTPSVPGTYTITVRAIDLAHNYSTQTLPMHVISPLPAPANVSAPSPTTNAPVLTWDPVAGAASYIVYKNGAQIAFTAGTNFTDTFAVGVYTYSVAAVDTNGLKGTFSAPVQVAVTNPAAPHANQAIAQGQTTVVPTFGSDTLPGLTSPSQTDKLTFDFDLGYSGTPATLKVSRQFTLTYKAPGQNLFVESTDIPWLVINGDNNSVGIFEGMADVTLNNGQPVSLPFHVEVVDGTRTTPTSAHHLLCTVYTDATKTQALYQVSQPLTKGKISIK